MSRNIAGWRASHVSGRWPVLMGPSSLVVVDPSTSVDLTELWQKVIGSATMADLVTVLAAIGPGQSPDLVALFWTESGMRSLVRGNLRLLDPATAEVVADGAGMLTWREVGLDDRTQVEIDLGAGPVGSRGLPLVVGAVHAGAVRLEAGEGAAVISPQALSFEQAIPPDRLTDRPARTDRGRAWSDAAPLESSEVDPIAAGALWPPVRRSPLVPGLSPSSAPFGPVPGPPVPIPPVPIPPVPGPPVPIPPVPIVPVLGGHAPPAEEDRESPIGPGGLTRRTSPPTTEEVVDPARLEMENADTELMAAQSGPSPTQEEPVVPAREDRPGPLVQAAICLSGHPNPPYADHCALCGAPVPSQTSQLVSRPVLGVLRSPDGSSVEIDRPILVGRAPVLRDDLAEVPELMRVPSPGQDISRTHLLVSPDDWEIRLTDLHSTNGTTIVRPGPGVERVQLQPGEPHAVTVGTVIELGDGVAVLVDGPPGRGH
jgi:hypothetical protein